MVVLHSYAESQATDLPVISYINSIVDIIIDWVTCLMVYLYR